jgi:hypothetical protein
VKTSRVVPLCVALAGCSLTALNERDPGIAVNQCDEETRCPEEQQCRALRCVANAGTLSTLLFEVAPGVSGGALSGAQLFQVGDKVPLVPADYSIALNDVIGVSGYVSAGLTSGCATTASSCSKGLTVRSRCG